MRTKILLFCLGSTLCALIIQTILFKDASSKLIYNQAKEESNHSLQYMQNEIYTFIKSMESRLINIYSEEEFEQSLKSKMSINDLRQDNHRLAYDFVTKNFETSKGVVALYIYNINNEIISTYRRAVTPKHNYPTDIYEDIEQYNSQKVLDYISSDDTTMLISSYYNRYRETDMIRFVLKIYDNTNLNSKIGYIVCDVDSKVLKNIMVKYCDQKEMFMWLQPMGDRQILSVGTLEDFDQNYYESNIEQIQAGEMKDKTDLVEGQHVLFLVEQDKYNLSAYSMMPQDLLKQNQKVLTQNLIVIGFTMSILITLSSILFSGGLTKRLELLTQTIAKIKLGNTHQRVEDSKNDEIGKLGHDFNEMLDKIEYFIGHEYETKLLLNKAEYKTLQSQINPHFLYNTLDTMSSIASIQNCAVVSNLCQSLSNIFRYSLDMKHSYSTVAKEFIHLKNYIYVMNVRMVDEVEYRFDISDEVLQDSIPRISIQPLVENALNHGLRNKRGIKKIEVNALELDGKLQITVKDNGVGMDAEEMNAKLAKNSKDAVESGSSIGLYNINARMKMLYGEEYGLHIESDIHHGTSVYLTIPRVKVEEVETWQK
ncbi:sensor histidine kinase [Lachnotalea glycerini]|nr:sensor histidine kinase [Lachnotalea glycerini]